LKGNRIGAGKTDQITLFGVVSEQEQRAAIYAHLNRYQREILAGKTERVPALPYHKILMTSHGAELQAGIQWWSKEDGNYWCEIDRDIGRLGPVKKGHVPRSSAAGSGGFVTPECRFWFWHAERRIRARVKSPRVAPKKP
jgi:hypothetical protein